MRIIIILFGPLQFREFGQQKELYSSRNLNIYSQIFMIHRLRRFDAELQLKLL